MKKQPLISVVLPVYNGQSTLPQTIESVLNQTYENWELIIVDDGSKDGTAEVARRYDDKRIKIVCLSENRHICNALNEGLSHAKGEYIARLDCGDLFAPNKLEKQLNYMQENPECGASFSWANLIDNDGNIINDKFPIIFELFSSQKNRSQVEWMERFIVYSNCICHPSAMIRKDVLDDVGWYDLAYVQGQDYDLWMRIVLKYPIYIFEECLVSYLYDLDDKGKISLETEENNTRFYNERVHMIEKIFEKMDDETFVKFFGSHFRKKDASGKIELECEKAFYLLSCVEKNYNYKYIAFQGIEKLYNLLQEDESREVLEKVYNFTLHDYYKLTTSHQYYDYFVQRRINELLQQVSNLEAQVISKQDEIGSLRAFIDREGKDISALQEAVLRRNDRIVGIQNSRGYRALRKVQNAKDQMLKREGYNPVFYLLGHDYGNMGDHLITSRMHEFLRHYFPKNKVVEISSRYYNEQKSQLVANVNPEDVLLIQGGVAISYKYFEFEEKYYWDLIHTFPHNQIIVFPHSLFFDSTPQEQEQLQKSGAVFSSHKHMTLCLRENNSVRIAEGVYNCNKLLAPDIALFGSAYHSLKPREDEALTIIREDCETKFSAEVRDEIFAEAQKRAAKLTKADTQLDYVVDSCNREEELEKMAEKFLNAKFVVTDRIHGMIFAALTQTPCVALDNSYGKVSGTYDLWLKGTPYIKLAKSADEVGSLIDEVLKVENPTFHNEHLTPYYDRLAQTFKI